MLSRWRVCIVIRMKRYVIAGCLVAGVGMGAGCAHQKTQRAPDITPQPVVAKAPDKPNWMERTADGAWQVVQAPAKLVGPKPKGKKAPPERYEPADAVILDRSAGEEAAGTEPATTQK